MKISVKLMMTEYVRKGGMQRLNVNFLLRAFSCVQVKFEYVSLITANRNTVVFVNRMQPLYHCQSQ